MSQLWLEPADIGTNRPGRPVCPRWLFLLDDPDPQRVLIIGGVSQRVLDWFGERDVAVQIRSLTDGVDVPRVTTWRSDVDLVVVGHEPETIRHHRDHSRITAAVRSRFRSPTAVASVGSSEATPTVVHTPSGTRLLHGTEGTVTSSSQHPAHTLRPGADSAYPNAPPPAWLHALADPWTSQPKSWSLQIPDAYPSQKAVAKVHGTTGASVVVKVTRHPRFNGRLDNESVHLRARTGQDPFEPNRRVPTALATAEVAGLRALVETAIDGPPFLEVSRLGPDYRFAEDAVGVIARLGMASRRDLPGAALAESLDHLLGRFIDRFAPAPDVVAHLHRQITVIGQAEIPFVLFHGDFGTWNLMTEADKVFMLDWESAQDPGPPLWDLAYFYRSYAVRSARRYGLQRNPAINRHLLGTSRLNAVGARWFAAYRRAIDLDPRLGAALFHTCWMHRAVKESLRLAPETPGHYGPLCLRLVRRRHDRGLTRLLGT